MIKKKALIIMGVLLVLILVISSLFLIGNLSMEKQYYKNQMLIFCEITEVQEEVILELDPSLEVSEHAECKYWILEGDSLE